MSSDRIKGGPAHGCTWDEFNEKFGNRIAALEETRRELQRQVSKLEVQAAKGRDFEALLKAVKTNPLVKKEWERFMMTLRMVGMDGST